MFEEEFIKKNHRKMTDREMGKTLGLTTSQVAYIRSNKLGIKKKGLTRWTLKEEAYLMDNFGKLTKKQIAANLNRTVPAIETRASILGVGTKDQHETRAKIESNIAKNRQYRKLRKKKALKKPEDAITKDEVKAYQLQPGQVYKLTKHNGEDKRTKKITKKLICRDNYQNIINFECMKGICYSIQKIDFLIGEVKVEKC